MPCSAATAPIFFDDWLPWSLVALREPHSEFCHSPYGRSRHIGILNQDLDAFHLDFCRLFQPEPAALPLEVVTDNSIDHQSGKGGYGTLSNCWGPARNNPSKFLEALKFVETAPFMISFDFGFNLIHA